jgi:hypothetical protein
VTAYSVSFTSTASTIVEVEADSPAEAADLAEEKFEPPSVCAQCAGWGRSGDSNSGIELSDEWDQQETWES